MALLLPHSDTLILEIPKCGTNWIRAALTQNRVEWREEAPITEGVGPRHNPAECYPPHRHVWASVRHPIGWVESYWRYGHALATTEWKPDKRLPRFAGHDTFTDWIATLLRRFNGAVTRILMPFLGESSRPVCDVVLRQEMLALDLFDALSGAGYDVSLRGLNAVRRENQSPWLPCDWNGQREAFIASERRLIERFYGASVRIPRR